VRGWRGALVAVFLGELTALAPAPVRADAGTVAAALVPIGAIVEDEIRAGRIPGAVVVVGHAGAVAYRRAFGDRQIEPVRRPMTEDTIFDLASLTKVIATSTAVMQLVEARRLRLEDPIVRYWPAFRAHGKARITVRDLLTHYSGLPPDLDLEGKWSGYGAALERIAAATPVGSRGGGFVYSDVNFAVLGEFVRRVSGEPLDVYCAKHIFGPLRMQNTGFKPSQGERVAPTTYIGGRLLSGVVHDPTARRMGGVAGHAGLFSTADDLAIFAQMMLDGGRAGPVHILRPDTVSAMTTPQSPPGAVVHRGLGWDIDSGFAADWHAALPDGSYGHTGYTGTSLWIDPASRTYVIVLTNRVHPDGRGDARPLRTRIAKVVAGAVGAGDRISSDRRPDRPGTVATGLDVLAEENFAPLSGLRVGLITNQTGLDATGRRTIDLMRAAPGVRLTAIFSPEHGLHGDMDGKVPSGREPMTQLAVYSLYGDVVRPTPTMLDGLDALVFDVQDAGVRFYTYVTTMAYALEAAAAKGIPFYVLDRPDPISAAVVQGPVLDDDRRSFTGYFPLPVRYGMTIGELAQLFNAENSIGAELHVIKMRGYRRAQWYDETGLRWIAPSPNLRSLGQAALYPGVALVEGANVSVGRGTETPFELLGAPWIDGEALASYLNRREIPGVRFEPVDFRPAEHPFADRVCHGVRVVLMDRAVLDAPRVGIEITSALHRLHRRQFQLDNTLGSIGTRWVLEGIRDGEDPRGIARRWQASVDKFLGLRAKYLLY
jgi:uncharacterized protein YbbC (DUF1343 family)/CubicO group peptidase (beta-lactamase class C family)